MAKPRPTPKTPVLLAGGNPQIARADGDSAVQTWLAATSGWKRDLVRSLDEALVTGWFQQASAIRGWGKSQVEQSRRVFNAQAQRAKGAEKLKLSP